MLVIRCVAGTWQAWRREEGQPPVLFRQRSRGNFRRKPQHLAHLSDQTWDLFSFLLDCELYPGEIFEVVEELQPPDEPGQKFDMPK